MRQLRRVGEWHESVEYMTRNRLSDITRSGFVAFLLIAQVLFLAVSVGAAPPVHTVSADQQAAIQTALGTGAPHGVWESRNEIAEFFLHADELADTPTAFVDDGPEACGFFGMDLKSSGAGTGIPGSTPNNRAIILGSNAPTGVTGLPVGVLPHYQTACFIAEQAPALDDIQVFNVGVNLYIAGLPPTGRAHISVYEFDSNGLVETWGTINARQTGATPSSAVFPGGLEYAGQTSYGADGRTLDAGNFLVIEIGTALEGANVFGTPAALYLDTTTYPSRFNVQADSARINIWTEEVSGDVTNTFGPANLGSGVPANVPDRQIQVRVLHANAWGHDQFELPGRGNDNNPVNNYHRLELRYMDDPTRLPIEINAGIKEWASVPSIRPAPHHEALATSTDGVVRLFTYLFTYPAGFSGDDPLTPDGLYRFEVRQTRQGWGQAYHSFIIGERGFEFGLLEGEVATHTVLPAEPTVFALQLNNTSPSSDLVGVAVSISGGWTAQLSGNQISLGPNDKQRVFLTVTPPATAQAGDSRLLTVTAASLTSNEIKTVQVRVNIVTTLEKGVDLTVVKPVIETRPGLTDNSFVQIRNSGNAADRYVITHTGTPAGWGVVLTPPSIDLFAASRSDILLQVTPPPTAQAGDGFTLVVNAVSAADGTVNDVLLIPIEIFTARGLVLDLITPEVQPRAQGDALCDAIDPICTGYSFSSTDTKFDRSVLVRYRLENIGDLDEVVLLRGHWDVPPGAIDAAACQQANQPANGIPDGWGFLIESRTGSAYGALSGNAGTPDATNKRGENWAAGFSGIYNLGSLTIPAGGQDDLYMEFGRIAPASEQDACPGITNTQAPSGIAGFTLQAVFEGDQSVMQSDSVVITTTAAGARLGQNVYANSINDVELDLAPNHSATGFVDLLGSTTYDLIIRNAGNEPDEITVTVAQGKEGWTHSLVFPPPKTVIFPPMGPGSDWTPNGLFGASGEGTDDVVRPVGCANPDANPRGFTCYLGVNDEFHVRVLVTPPADARFGDSQTATVQAISGSDGHVFKAMTLLTTVTAPFAFQADELRANLEVEQGGVAAFPYTIKNLGQRPDNYVLRVLVGPESWLPQVSATGQVFVPAQLSHHGFLTVRAPSSATIGQVEHFRVEVESLGELTNPTDNKRQVLDFFATVVAPSQLVLEAPPVIARQGTSVQVAVTAEDLSGSAGSAIFRVDPLSLPLGWAVEAANPDGTPAGVTEAIGVFNEDNRAQVVFLVTAPALELSTSRIALRINATTDTELFGFTDAQIDLGTVFGLSLEKVAPKALVVPGKTVEHVLNVTNNGLTADTVTMTTAPLPAGWGINFDQVSFTLQPLETRQVIATVAAPAGLQPGTTSTILVFASSAGDTSKVAQTTLLTEVGLAKLEVTVPAGVQYLAPEETGTFAVRVLNNGTLHDNVLLEGILGPTFSTTAQFEPHTPTFELAPGQAKNVLVDFTMPRLISAPSEVPVNVVANSAFEGIIGSATLTAQILPHVSQDIDGDGIEEYAVNRDRDSNTGHEEFRESSLAGGVQTQVPDLARFLTAEAAAAKTVNGSLRYFIDGDGDGRADFLLDTNGDGLPNLYWDPDTRHVTRLDIQRDVTGDGVREYFIDVDGDGLLDVWFDLTTGVFGRLLQVDVDGDGIMDYIVDLNGNGQADANEPVLFARTGGLITVRLVDVTGDGRLDQVFDIDGDGNPDYFIPAGSTRSVPIVLQDVTGDGVADWTYDSSGDGRRDSYYDPVTGKTGVMNSFTQSLLEHWYIGALFVLVAALFVALLVVTRRR